MKIEELFKITQIPDYNGNQQKVTKKGKVLAVSTYVDKRRVCFQIEGEKNGKWFTEEEITGTPSDQEEIKKEFSRLIHAAITPLNQIPPGNQTNDKRKKSDDPFNKEAEAKKEAKQNIHALEKYVADTSNAIQHQATKDIQTLVQSLQDTQKAIQESTQAVMDALVNYTQQTHEWLKQTIQGAIEVINYIEKTLNELWSRYWRNRIIDAIRGQRLHHSKAREIVKKLQQDYPYETSRQIANRLIQEKALFATITGPLPILTAGIPKVGLLASKMVVEFLNVRGLLVEMIYQIGVSYGFDEFKEGDYLVIFTLSFRSEKLAKLGMEFLLEDSIPEPIIPAVTNMFMFLSVGYAACEFYEAKAKGVASPIASLKEFTALEEKIAVYLEEVISAQTTIEATVVQAVCLKEELATI